MQHRRASGQEGFCNRECGRSDLSGGRSQGVHERDDLRRLEVVAEGLTLFGGCQSAIDATVVSPLHADGRHRRRADAIDGQALGEARRLKERTNPELCRGDGRARLVVIAGEVGGRWSQETKAFLWCLAFAKAAAVPRRL